MAKVKLILDTRNRAKNDKFPVKLKVFHRNSCHIHLNKYCRETQWNFNSNRFKPSVKNYQDLNFELNQKVLIAEKVIAECDEVLKELTNVELKEMIVAQLQNNTYKKHEVLLQTSSSDSKASLFTYGEQLIKRFESFGKVGNARTYKYTIDTIKNFSRNEDVLLRSIDYRFLDDFRAFMQVKAMKDTTISIILRTLRAIINKAIKEKILNQNDYPFKDFKIKTPEPTKKRVITTSDILAIKELELDPSKRIWDSRNYFLFMFYMMGMNFIDLAWLRMHDIKGGRLEYTRRKTRQSYSIKITDKAFNILEHYQKGKQVGSTDFIFPILKKSDVRDAIKANKIYKNRLKYFNRDLKEIAQMAEIPVNLTSYYSRHSWATIGKLKGTNTEILKQGLGHNNITTTEIYLDQFPNELMDEANEQITNLDD